jgi:hypothetical protein
LGLGKFGICVKELHHPLPPVLVFHGWLEDWETGLLNKNDQLAEAKLLNKYKGLQFYDDQYDVKYTVLSFKLEFVHDGVFWLHHHDMFLMVTMMMISVDM